MGSAKDWVEIRKEPTSHHFGEVMGQANGYFSVKDMKKLIPRIKIKNKAEVLTLENAVFMERLKLEHLDINTCFMYILDQDGKPTTVDELVSRGDLTDKTVMRFAYVPETYSNGDLNRYRQALASGELQCAVGDVESIFRKGFPLGSSTFEKMFKAVGLEDMYRTLATYDEVVEGLDQIRGMVTDQGLGAFPDLEKLLQKSGLGTTIPNPGFILKDFTYDSTSKFEKKGDRPLSLEEQRAFSGLSDEGYERWTQDWFPRTAAFQLKLGREHGITVIDGKEECVAYRKLPWLADFGYTIDENRKMTIVEIGGVEYAIPSNKEIQRAIFTKYGIDEVKARAIEKAEAGGRGDEWTEYFPAIAKDMGVDINGVTEESIRLMEYAVAEVGNRVLGKVVFDVPPIKSWVGDFLPYASRLTYQEAA